MQPVATLASSGLSAQGNTVLRVYENRVEIDEAHLRGVDTTTIRYSQIASVYPRSGFLYGTLTIETNGGKSFVLKGMPKARMQEAAGEVNARLPM